jgi:hypothetical protein
MSAEVIYKPEHHTLYPPCFFVKLAKLILRHNLGLEQYRNDYGVPMRT